MEDKEKSFEERWIEDESYAAGKKAGIKYVLARAVSEGCLSEVKKKHGIHIPDELYEELSKEAN